MYRNISRHFINTFTGSLCCKRQHHGQTIHPKEKLISMNLFKICCVVTWARTTDTWWENHRRFLADHLTPIPNSWGGQSIFCLPFGPKVSDFFDLCLHWVSVVRGHGHNHFLPPLLWRLLEAKNIIASTHFGTLTQCLVHPTVPFLLTPKK